MSNENPVGPIKTKYQADVQAITFLKKLFNSIFKGAEGFL